MTKNKRFSFAASPELEDRIIQLRKTDAFCRMTSSEILRTMIERALEQMEKE